MRFLRNLALALIGVVGVAWVLAQAEDIRGRGNIKNPREQMELAAMSQATDRYDYAEFTVAAVVDYSLKTNQNMFKSSGVPTAHNVNIRSDGNFKVKFTNVNQSSSQAKGISVASTESPSHWTGIETQDVWITCPGACNMKVAAW